MNHFNHPVRLLFGATAFLVVVLLFTGPSDAQTISTVAGTGKATLNMEKGHTKQFNIGDPFGVEFGPDGHLYICEVKNHRIIRCDLTTGNVETIAGTGKKGYSGDGGPAAKAELNEPYEIRFADNGDIYFVEMQNHLVRKIDRQGVISTVAGNGKRGFSGDGGRATDAMFNRPHSIAIDQDRWLYVADIGNHRIRRVDLKENRVISFAGAQKKSLPSDGGNVTGMPVLGPRALFITPDPSGQQKPGVLWVALREGNSVWNIDLKSPKWNLISGTGKKGYTGDGGPAKAATWNGPKGIAVEGQKCYVVDTENQAIRMIRLEKGTVITVAGNGRQGGSGDNGPATSASLARPHGICIHDGAVFIGDTLNHRIRRVELRKR